MTRDSYRSSPRRRSDRPTSGTSKVTFLRLAIYIGVLVAILFGYARIGDPAFWATVFPGFAVDTEIAGDDRTPELVAASTDDVAGPPVEDPAPEVDAAAPNDQTEGTVKALPTDRNRLNEVFRDKTGRRSEETESIHELLDYIANLPTDELAKQANPEVLFVNLFTDPSRYRGTVVPIRGILRRLILHEVRAPNGQTRRYYEGWVFTQDQPTNPTLVLMTAPPEGVQPSERLTEEIAANGIFVKLYAFRTQDGRLIAAPMLISGQPRHVVLPNMTYSAVTTAAVILGAILAMALVLVVWQSRRDKQTMSQLRSEAPEIPREVPRFEEGDQESP